MAGGCTALCGDEDACCTPVPVLVLCLPAPPPPCSPPRPSHLNFWALPSPPPTARLRGHLPTSRTALCCPGRWCCCPAGPGPLLGNPPAVAASASTALDSVPSPAVDPFLDLLWALAAPPSPTPSSGHEALSPGHFPSPTPRQAQMFPHSPSCAPAKSRQSGPSPSSPSPSEQEPDPQGRSGTPGSGPQQPQDPGPARVWLWPTLGCLSPSEFCES